MSIPRKRPGLQHTEINVLEYDPMERTKRETLARLRPRSSRMQVSHSKYVARLESLRTSPYMFFHGESPEYSEAAKAREEEKLNWSKSTETKNPVFGYTLMSSPPAPPPLLVDNIFDDLNSDGFAGGSVLRSVERVLQRRRQVVEVRKKALMPLLESAPNMNTLRALLLRCIAVTEKSAEAEADPQKLDYSQSNDALMLNINLLKREMKFTYEIANEALLDMFFRSVCGRAPGRPMPETVSLKLVADLFETFVAGRDARGTAESCFKIVDFKECQIASLQSLRQLRGTPARSLPRTMSFSMLKAAIDIFVHQPEATLTMTQDDFCSLFLLKDELVTGFMEEILRYILVRRFGYDAAVVMSLYNK